MIRLKLDRLPVQARFGPYDAPLLVFGMHLDAVRCIESEPPTTYMNYVSTVVSCFAYLLSIQIPGCYDPFVPGGDRRPMVTFKIFIIITIP